MFGLCTSFRALLIIFITIINHVAGKLGKIQIVGVSPFRPDFLTRKVHDAFTIADVAITDSTLELRELAPFMKSFRKIYRDPSPSELHEIIQQHRNENIISLKQGDPLIYENTREMDIFRQYGKTEVLPGLSSIFSAPLLAGIPLTHRNVADHVWIGTGEAFSTENKSLPQFDPHLSLLILMFLDSIHPILSAFSVSKWGPDTPIAIIEHAETEMQHVVIGSIAALQWLVEHHSIQEPAVLVVGECVRVLHQGTWSGALHTKIHNPIKPNEPSITLIGTGPGSADYLTLSAESALQNSDIVITDRLVDESVISLLRSETEIIIVGDKKSGRMDTTQAEIYGAVLTALGKRKRVSRLKIGDPFVYGRGGEEVLEYRQYGLEPIVIPGISSALLAPLSVGMCLTPSNQSTIWLGTGFGQAGKMSNSFPMYDHHLSVVLLMAVARLREICVELVGNGWPEDTPVAVIEKAATLKQRVTFGFLEDIGVVCAEKGVKAPATVVVGNCADEKNCFTVY